MLIETSYNELNAARTGLLVFLQGLSITACSFHILSYCKVPFFFGSVVGVVALHLEICWVIGFHRRVDFGWKNSDGPSVFTCLAWCPYSRSLLIVTVLVISFFLAADEGFIPLYVGGNASVCGWLRYPEVLR